MTNLVTAFLGLGSNLDDPIQQVNRALKTLATTEGIAVELTSSLYQTPPVGPILQPDFINAVCMITTTLAPESLLTYVLGLELEQHRVREERWGPRTLDIDLLMYDTIEYHSDRLTIPHPELLNRPFWLVPLAEIVPEWMLPNGEKVGNYVKKWNTADITKI